jgi:hypothetical protein
MQGKPVFFNPEPSVMRTSYYIRSIAAVAVAAFSLSAVAALYAQKDDESSKTKAAEAARFKEVQAKLNAVIQELTEGREGEPLRRVIVLSDGAVVPAVKRQFAGFPSDTSLMIRKEGDQPAHIVVKKDGKKFEATEDKLDELPEDIRRLVAPLLGKQSSSADGVKIQPWIELRKTETSKKEQPKTKTSNKKLPEKGAAKEKEVDNPKVQTKEKDPTIKRENIKLRAIPEGARIEVREFKLADPKQGRIKVEVEPKLHKPAPIELKANPSKNAPEAKGAGIERRLDEVLKRLDALEKSLSRLRRELDEDAK